MSFFGIRFCERNSTIQHNQIVNKLDTHTICNYDIECTIHFTVYCYYYIILFDSERSILKTFFHVE